MPSGSSARGRSPVQQKDFRKARMSWPTPRIGWSNWKSAWAALATWQSRLPRTLRSSEPNSKWCSSRVDLRALPWQQSWPTIMRAKPPWPMARRTEAHHSRYVCTGHSSVVWKSRPRPTQPHRRVFGHFGPSMPLGRLAACRTPTGHLRKANPGYCYVPLPRRRAAVHFVVFGVRPPLPPCGPSSLMDNGPLWGSNPGFCALLGRSLLQLMLSAFNLKAKVSEKVPAPPKRSASGDGDGSRRSRRRSLACTFSGSCLYHLIVRFRSRPGAGSGLVQAPTSHFLVGFRSCPGPSAGFRSCPGPSIRASVAGAGLWVWGAVCRCAGLVRGSGTVCLLVLLPPTFSAVLD